MSSALDSTSKLTALLARLDQAGVDSSAIEAILRTVLDEHSTASLVSWARRRGETQAKDSRDIQPAIQELLTVSDALAGLDLDGPANGRLASALVGAAVEGFLAAKRPVAEIVPVDLLRDRVAELTALHRIISSANSSLNLSDMLNMTAQTVVAVTQADICSIFLYEPEWDQLVLTSTSGLNQESVGKVRLALGEGITGYAAMAGRPIAVRDAWDHPRFKYVPALHEENTISILAVPVVLFTKEKLVGVITVHTFEERDFTDTEVKFLETVAGEIAIAIENARLYQQTDAQLRRKVNELSTLQGVSAHIAATLDLPEVLALITHQASHLVQADAAAFYELHSDAGMLELVAEYDRRDPSRGLNQGKAGRHLLLGVDRSAIAHAVVRGIPVALPSDADAALGVPFANDGYRSLFCVPLVAPRGIMGSICLYNEEERSFSEDQVRLLDAFAHEAAIALENSRLYDAALRGLKTKSAMLQEMNHRVRNNLQTVAGLLSMQLRRMPPDGEAAVAIRESISRIQSMAVVHDLMMRGAQEIEWISIYELALKVSEAAISTLAKPSFRLEFSLDPKEADSIRVGSQEATLLALLFNELMSNAILHGFAGRESGRIAIRVWREAEDPRRDSAGAGGTDPWSQAINIEVEDNGNGLPPGFDVYRGANLGLNIVRTLVRSDLRGEFRIGPGSNGEGTTARIFYRPSRIG